MILINDETDVDLTKYCDTQSVTPSEAISRLRQEVFDTTGLTVSAGVSPNKALSKICADVNKPNGQFVIDPTKGGCMAFMKDIRLRRCFGLGRVTECLLNKIGFVTVGDLWERRADLYLVVSRSSFHLLEEYRSVVATTFHSVITLDKKRLSNGYCRSTWDLDRIESYVRNAGIGKLMASSEFLLYFSISQIHRN